MTVIDSVARHTIAFCRDAFRNTWVHDLRITNVIYEKVFRAVDRPRVIAFRDIQLAIDQNDATITPTLITGQYERREFDLLESILRPGMTFVDVGANNGSYTCIAASLVGADGAVVSFEPIAANLELLRESIDLNAPATDNVTVIAEAVGAETGEITIYLDGDNSGTHSVGATGSTSTGVAMSTLDAALEGREPDLVKIDVEGFELAVLEGADQVMKRFQPVLLCEFDRGMVERVGDDPDRLAARLDEHGSVYEIDERRAGLKRVTSDAIAVMQNSNLLVVPDCRREMLASASLVDAAPA